MPLTTRRNPGLNLIVSTLLLLATIIIFYLFIDGLGQGQLSPTLLTLGGLLIVAPILIGLFFARLAASDPPLKRGLSGLTGRHPLLFVVMFAGATPSLFAVISWRNDNSWLLIASAINLLALFFFLLLWAHNLIAPTELRATLRRLVSQRPFAGIAIASAMLLLLAVEVLWLQPFASFPALALFLANILWPVGFGYITLTLTLNSLANGSLSQSKGMLNLAMYVVITAILAFNFSIVNCGKVDCGGALLRSAAPAPWSEQLAAALDGARDHDPKLALYSVSAVPNYQQPPGYAIPILQVYFDFVASNKTTFNVLIEDNAPVWKRDTVTPDFWANQPDLETPAKAIAAALPYIKLSPSDALRATWVEGQAYMGNEEFLRPRIELYSHGHPLWPKDLPAGSQAAWRVLYPSADYSSSRLILWLDAANGALLKREFQ